MICVKTCHVHHLLLDFSISDGPDPQRSLKLYDVLDSVVFNLFEILDGTFPLLQLTTFLVERAGAYQGADVFCTKGRFRMNFRGSVRHDIRGGCV